MSQVLMTMAVANAPIWNIIGIKEAIMMDLEQKYGDVKLLRIEVQEPEQMSLSGVAPSRPTRPASKPAAPPQAGEAPARRGGNGGGAPGSSGRRDSGGQVRLQRRSSA